MTVLTVVLTLRPDGERGTCAPLLANLTLTSWRWSTSTPDFPLVAGDVSDEADRPGRGRGGANRGMTALDGRPRFVLTIIFYDSTFTFHDQRFGTFLRRSRQHRCRRQPQPGCRRRPAGSDDGGARCQRDPARKEGSARAARSCASWQDLDDRVRGGWVPHRTEPSSDPTFLANESGLTDQPDMPLPRAAVPIGAGSPASRPLLWFAFRATLVSGLAILTTSAGPSSCSRFPWPCARVRAWWGSPELVLHALRGSARPEDHAGDLPGVRLLATLRAGAVVVGVAPGSATGSGPWTVSWMDGSAPVGRRVRPGATICCEWGLPGPIRPNLAVDHLDRVPLAEGGVEETIPRSSRSDTGVGAWGCTGGGWPHFIPHHHSYGPTELRADRQQASATSDHPKPRADLEHGVRGQTSNDRGRDRRGLGRVAGRDDLPALSPVPCWGRRQAVEEDRASCLRGPLARAAASALVSSLVIDLPRVRAGRRCGATPNPHPEVPRPPCDRDELYDDPRHLVVQVASCLASHLVLALVAAEALASWSAHRRAHRSLPGPRRDPGLGRWAPSGCSAALALDLRVLVPTCAALDGTERSSDTGGTGVVGAGSYLARETCGLDGREIGRGCAPAAGRWTLRVPP